MPVRVVPVRKARPSSSAAQARRSLEAMQTPRGSGGCLDYRSSAGKTPPPEGPRPNGRGGPGPATDARGPVRRSAWTHDHYRAHRQGPRPPGRGDARLGRPAGRVHRAVPRRPGHLRRQRRPAPHPGRPRPRRHGSAVGRQRLLADVRRVPPPGRARRRPVRAQARLHHRPRPVHRRQPRRRVRPGRRHADRGPRRAGARRRDPGARHAVADHRHVPRGRRGRRRSPCGRPSAPRAAPPADWSAGC